MDGIRKILIAGLLLFCSGLLAYASYSSRGPAVPDGILVEAESFADKGGWKVDQQFMDQMGSPYLIAHGLGRAVEDASTEISIRKSGTYHIWVRTYNWTAPWNKEEGPGAFRIKIGGKILEQTLGTTGSRWNWQYAGSAKLKAGKSVLALSDLTGFDGRCDAIFLSRETGLSLPDDLSGLDLFRRRCGTLPKGPSDGGEFDLVVVGVGIGGICTAVSAARLGLKVALISDRPVIGGNNSAEIRVHLGGRSEMEPYPALGRMFREFGHSRGGNAQPAENYEDWKKDAIVKAEENITELRNFRAVKVSMDGSRISSVVIRHIENGSELKVSAPLFADCTGDGNLGFMAGADWRMGREGRDEFGEPLAPEKGDDLTMGASVQWYSTETAEESIFPEFSWGPVFNEENFENVKLGEWTWETGMNFDQINDFERIRDYGMLVIYANWSYIKNHSSVRSDFARRELGWVAYVAGKRESRRLMGDYVLKQGDVDKQVFHEDASFTTTWHFDLHFPDKVNSSHFPGNEFKAETKHNPIYPYAVPYRCLYSRNVDNMFMAGRNISVTHVALGSTRLMRTIGMMGEVVGMAASICKEHGVLPRKVYQTYLPELKELMKKGVSDTELPFNQGFNEGDTLKAPKPRA